MSFHLTTRRNREDAGYFRLGHIILSIPPEEISTEKIINNREVVPLRSRHARYLKTGHSRYDVTIRWKSLGDFTQQDYQDWESLREILAIFHAAPFVEVESEHLRQIICKEDPSFSPVDRMGFALRQLRVDTVPDIVDGLQCTLTMSLFNYRPFSKDFGYKGTSGQSVSAYESEDFKNYIARWVVDNLDRPMARQDNQNLRDWRQINPGEMKFFWRHYAAVPVEQPDMPEAQDQPSPEVTPPTPATKSAPAAKGSPREPVEPPSSIRAIIEQACREKGCDVNLALAVCQQESGFNPNAKNPTSSASGLFQLTTAAAKEMGVTNVFDPLQNARGGIGYIMKYAKAYGSMDLGLVSFKSGPGVAKNGGIAAAITRDKEFPIWFRNVKYVYAKRSGQQTPAAPTQVAQKSEIATVLQQVQPKAQNPDEGAAIAALEELGWVRDHKTGAHVFMYQPHSFQLHDHEHMPGENTERLYPTGISVVFANNLAQLPLEDYQYPTYQHIGPAGTMISIGMMSDGVMEGEMEPIHPGAAKLTGMASSLENQYHHMKGEWRAVSSVHRMQSVTIENQILNLLGIYNVIPQNVGTQTVPESPNLLEVRFSCSQYENIYEVISPYLVKGTAEYDKVWQKEVLDGNFLDTLPKDDATIEPVRKYQDAYKGRDTGALFDYLTNSEAAPQNVPMNVPLDASTEKVLRDSIKWDINGAGSFERQYPGLAEKIRTDSAINYNDYVLLTNYPGTKDTPQVKGIREATNQRILEQAQQGSPDPTRELYTQVLDHERSHSRAFSSAIQQIEAQPGLQEKLQNAVDGNGPGSNRFNQDHGSYKDLGLKGLDDTPSSYFINHSSEFRQEFAGYSGKAAQQAVQTAQYFNDRTKLGSTADVQTTDGITTGVSSENIANILNRTIIPFNSMERAFPTYKLFLIEEDNKGLFYMFDDFYSYSNVLNMEVSRNQDAAKDVAVIQLTNMANLLSHKLFDNSIEGKVDRKYSHDIQVQGTDNGEATAGPTAGAAVGFEDAGGGNYQDLSPGLDNSGKKVRLQYFALQTGTKIQVRVGYSNNPDNLYPVFSGIVTNVQEGEVMTLTAQGFAAELTYAAPDDIDYNGYNIAWAGAAVGKVAAGIREGLSGEFSQGLDLITGSLGRGPAYGGIALMGEAGDAVSVIQSMLKVSTAVHFGHWQVGTQAEDILKGYSFQRLLAGAAGAVGADRASSMLRTGYDRSGENVYVSKLRTFDGDVKDAHLTRDYQMETPLNLLPAMYYIPKDPQINPWRIIQDVKRRYPEYIVTVKPYGFPYGCDATLVFAHPNDFYFGRMPLLGEAELGKVSPEDAKYFRQWWDGTGRRAFESVVETTNLNWTPFALDKVRGSSTFLSTWQDKNTAARELMTMIEGAQDGLSVFSKVIDAALEAVRDQESSDQYGLVALMYLGLARNYHGSQTRALRQNLIELKKKATIEMQLMRSREEGLSTDPKPNDRIQPVRKWHLISFQNIIHNGIELNHNIHNAVRVDDRSFAANSGIENVKAHMKLLDVDQVVIDPVNNIRLPKLHRSYAASFMKEELGKMYQGELVLVGIPELEPYDVIQLWDPSKGMAGPVEVESIVHSFDQDLGYISIVRPRALVSVNEAFTAGVFHATWSMLTNLTEEAGGLLKDFINLPGGQQAVIGAGGAAAAAGTAIGVGALTGAATAAGGTVATVASSLALPLTAGAAAIGFVWLSTKRQDMNPMLIAPLTRYGRPWVAGVEGWAMHDLHTYFKQKWQIFNAYELQPTLAGLKEVLGIANDFR